ncbi:hypothetical protein [Anaeromyxobacter oryzae]|uniref:Lipoprotein n=1 Tax=Anaeromyxobacter oryzae TaxID=2918170 RepID=A0ABM7X119_9BACT|nr:hypothetical protein [Anaeromyxobacter oryzae]BDG05453.1 hypothetical protein AMOR_44490 [Anaeromyxobacter oryzae]
MISIPSALRLSFPLLLLVTAACSRTAAQPTVEAALPAAPGQAWASAHDALARLDPHLRDAAGLGGRTATAKSSVVVAGYRFDQVAIAGLADRDAVRSVTLSAPSPKSGCEKIREDLLKALGSEWDAGETRLGAVTATKTGRSARIVCNGAEFSLAIIG